MKNLLERARKGEFDWIKGDYRFGFCYPVASRQIGIESLSKRAKRFYVYFHFWFISFYVWRKYGGPYE